MKSINKYLFGLFLIIVLPLSLHAQGNTLSVPDINVAGGKSVSMPFNLDNTADIVALQFTLTLPDGFSLSTTSVRWTNRAADHSMTVRQMRGNKYKFLAYAPSNTAFTGSAGQLFSILLTASETLEEDSEHQPIISDLILSLRDGNNVATGSEAGKITITKSPDLVVSDINVEETNIVPDGEISLSWKISNIGGAELTSGWTENVYLFSPATGQEIFVGSQNHDLTNGNLAVDGVVNRSASFTLPSILGIDGDVKIRVIITPYSDSGERAENRDNNEAESTQTLNLAKYLYLSVPARVDENSASAYSCVLQRSGDNTKDEVFYITSTDSRLVLPELATIKAYQSAVRISFTISDNQIIDEDSIAIIEVSGNDYAEVSRRVIISDDEHPTITLSIDKDEITEGESATLAITTDKAYTHSVTLNISCSAPSRFDFPAEVTLPANAKQTSLTITAVDNSDVEEDEDVVFYVRSNGYNTGEASVLLKDNDLPEISLTITPNRVSESSGPAAMIAKVSRQGNTDSRVVIRLSDDSDGDIFYTMREVILNAGVAEQTFALGINDNTQVDGDRVVNISAAIYMSSCSCTASSSGAGYVSTPITILDDDGPALQLKAATSSVNEGSTEGAQLIISRNTDTQEALTVSLSCSETANITFPETVIIPVGQTSVNVQVLVAENGIENDNRTITFTAEAQGYASSVCWLYITDQTLPDIVIDNIRLSKDSIVANQSGFKVSVVVANRGVSDLPSGVPITLYLGDNIYGIKQTTQLLHVAETEVLTFNVAALENVGAFPIYASADREGTISELLTTNNRSQTAYIQVEAPFNVTLTTDKTTYMYGESVSINGKAQGIDATNAQVEVYFINLGYRKSQLVTTDDQGEFSLTFTPDLGQFGHFSIGACYPSENLKTEMVGVDFYGLIQKAYVYCDLLENEQLTYYLPLYNPSSLPLHNLHVDVVEKSDEVEIAFNDVALLSGNQTLNLPFDIKASTATESSNYELIKIKISTAEGVDIYAYIHYYCTVHTGRLEVSFRQIELSTIDNQPIDFAITLYNTGAGETGSIKFNLPSFMQLIGTTSIPSIGSDREQTIAIRITPDSIWPYNYSVTGTIAAQCDYNAISIPYRITNVSSAEGTLQVDVCDEKTYYNAAHPHLQGATVSVFDYQVDTLVQSGQTDANGLFTTQLRAGYYKLYITAEKHKSDALLVYVEPEQTHSELVNLSFTGLTVDYHIEETEIEDVYTITNTISVDYNVPVPQVVTTMPNRVNGDSLNEGESLIFVAKMKNEGLITAQDVQLILPEPDEDWTCELLAFQAPFDLPAGQEVSIPVRLTKLAHPQQTNARRRASSITITRQAPRCYLTFEPLYYWDCGTDRKWHRYHIDLPHINCNLGEIAITLSTVTSDSIPSLDPNPPAPPTPCRKWCDPTPPIPICDGCGGGWDITLPTIHLPEIPISVKGCIPCQVEKSLQAIRCGIEIAYPPAGTFFDIAEMGVSAAKMYVDYRDKGKVDTADVRNIVDGAADFVREQAGDYASEHYLDPALGAAEQSANKVFRRVARTFSLLNRYLPYAECLRNLISPCTKTADNSDDDKTKEPPEKKKFDSVGKDRDQQQTDKEKFICVLFNPFDPSNPKRPAYSGDIEPETLDTVLCSLLDLQDKYGSASFDSLRDYVPETISDNILRDVLDYVGPDLDNELDNYRNGTGDHHRIDTIITIIIRLHKLEEDAIAEGYTSFEDKWQQAYATYMNYLDSATQSVCATIGLQFDQEMVMTRQAFRGYLTVFNGHDSIPMHDVTLNLVVKNTQTGDVTTEHEFEINVESLNKFEGNLSLTDGWSLAAGDTGRATILYIPTKFAALTDSVKYSFSGTIRYTDPFNGETTIQPLTPQTLTVAPAPNLQLTYFTQRDILGDDPLTEKVEPIEEAEFALLINNIGYGPAKNLSLVTPQPKIVSNDKGLLVKYELTRSMQDGKQVNLALDSTITNKFGSIAGKSTTYAQWFLTSSLLGHCTDYNVSYSHLTGYGNADLSLIDTVTVHEMIRSIDVPATGSLMVGWLANDLVDANDYPDMLYRSDGSKAEIEIAQNVTLSQFADHQCRLTVNADNVGWVYGNISDPTYGTEKLVSITRQSDSAEISLRNFWQTDRTLRDGKDPLYENRIHFADSLGSQSETYILFFEQKPYVELDITSISGLPQSTQISDTLIKNVIIEFNKAIVPSTFTNDDLSITRDGKQLDASQIIISHIDSNRYSINLQGLTDANGFYSLMVNLHSITDVEGFLGKENGGNNSASWQQFKDGKVNVAITVVPENAGVVSPNVTALNYGDNYAFTASANAGYVFSHWAAKNISLGTNAEYKSVAISDVSLTANFALAKYRLAFAVNDSLMGSVNGVGGIYDYGSQVSVSAVANTGYHFVRWSDGNTEPARTITVQGDITYVAVFAINQYAVRFLNFNDSVLQSVVVNHGSMPQYSLAEPQREASAQWSYRFKSWKPTIVPAVAIADYKAVFDSVLNKYQISFVADGRVLQADSVEYGSLPEYLGAVPMRAATAQWTYSFKGWSPMVGNVVGDAVYIAQFDSTLNKYTVRFLSEDGQTVLQSSEFDYGSVPVFSGAVPQKEGNIQWRYEFNNKWQPEIAAVTTNADYRAVYDSVLMQYEVKFLNCDGSLIDTMMVDFGAVPVYNRPAPRKPATSEFVYRFIGWSPELAEVTGPNDYSYTAQFEATTQTYTVTYLNYDGSELLRLENVPYGSDAAAYYNGTTPQKPADVQYSYSFSGWSGSLIVDGDITLTAQYSNTLNKYLIRFIVDSVVLQSESLDYGTMPEYNEAVPTRRADAQYTYSFRTWQPSVKAVAGAQDYIAVFDSTLNYYAINFISYDGSILRQDSLGYGSMPECEEPVKPANVQWTYSFKSWTPQIVSVTGDATYTAVIDSVLNKYQITFNNYDGTTLQSGMVNYGEVPTYNGATPTKPNTAQWTYSFAGWQTGAQPSSVAVELPQVIGNATYTAQFYSTLNYYAINFLNYDNSILRQDSLGYGEMPTCDTPTKSATAQWTYTFKSWTPAIASVTADATYIAQYDSTLNYYIITFISYDGSTIKTDNLAYGAMPQCEEPVKPTNVQWTYSFKAWTPAIASVTGDATYVAVIDSVLNKYQITFNNYDGTTLQSNLVEYGAVPTYIGATPTKPKTAQWTYSFIGWQTGAQPSSVAVELPQVIGDAIYTAQFESTLNYYAINFVNYDNSILRQDSLGYGSMPSCDTPTKPATAQWTYTFKTWIPAIASVTADATYIAQYDSTLNYYNITFISYDGSTIKTDNLAYGAMPECEEPVKPANVQWTYSFRAWTPAIASVTGDATYVAVIDSVLNKYQITFTNYDGTTLQSGMVNYGEVPVYNGATPSKPATAQWTYSFAGWQTGAQPSSVAVELPQVIGNAIYTAQFDSTLNYYAINFLNYDNSIIRQDSLAYGSMPSCDTPTKPATAQWTYTFKSWTPAIANVTADATYKAVFDSTLNYYAINFISYDGSILRQDSLGYGAMPQCEEPVKPANVQWTYSFKAWSPAIASVIGDATYTAVIDSVLNQYQITFNNYDGTILQSGMVNYGEVPVYNGATPSKPATAQWTYSFIGWQTGAQPSSVAVELPQVIGDAIYTAQFDSTLNYYAINFLNYDNSILRQDSLGYGSMPSCDTPTKPATAQWTYTFKSWTPAIANVTADATYKAVFDSTLNYYAINFISYDGSILRQDSLGYGAMPTCAEPVKPANVQWTYSFKAWSPAIASVIGDATYTAVIDSVLNQYQITFNNYDGTTLQSGMVNYGEVPVYNGATPSKPATAQWTYSFAGWQTGAQPSSVAVELPQVIGAETYTAQFDSTLNYYAINFLNYDNSILRQDSLGYGAMPSCDIPTKPATAQWTYTFKSWTPAIASVTADATYIAQYDSTLNAVKVEFVSFDGTLLQSDYVLVGEMPEYRSIIPNRLPSVQYNYTFIGWTPELTPATEDVTYVATYSEELRSYTINFVNYDGELLQSDTIEYGSMPQYTGAEPQRPATQQYHFNFSGWDRTIRAVEHSTTYTAQYDSILNKYQITFANYDGITLQTDSVEYGTVPQYEGAEPQRPATVQWTYRFSGWTPELEGVEGEATYTARYDSVLNTYTISFYDYDSTLLHVATFAYGTMPEYDGPNPQRRRDDKYNYNFAGWNPQLTEVVGDAGYIAVYDSTLREFSVLYLNYDGTMLYGNKFSYGDYPHYSGSEPQKPATDEWTYIFSGWSPEETVVTTNAVYTAQYDSLRLYSLTLNVNDSLRGTVSGAGVYAEGTEVEIHAQANGGYAFSQWSDGVTDSVRVIVITSDTVLTAEFSIITAIETAEAEVAISINGMEIEVSAPSGTTVGVYTVTGQLIYYGSEHRITLPQPGHYVVRVGQYTRRIIAN